MTTFVGREREIAEVRRLLCDTRLLTLTGIGGIGKSRLALQVAAALFADYPAGVRLVDLTALSNPGLVPETVAAALGVPEQPGRPVTAALTRFLRSRTLLMVLDNCEHVLAGCAALIGELLRAAPHLRILATSRAAIGIAGETQWRVPSLTLPDPQQVLTAHQLFEFEAVRLFIERARAADPRFSVAPQNVPAVAQICVRLDGIPLAIELAARWVRALTLEEIASRLDDRFRLLVAPPETRSPRQRTLRATLDWSYELLTPQAQSLLRRLAVFAGGAPLQAVEAVAAGPDISIPELPGLLSQLVDKSLLLFDPDGPHGRYRILESVRHYAREKLRAAGEETETCRRHRDWYLGLAEQATAAWRGPNQIAWLNRLETEHDNLRSALEWSSREDGGAEAVLRLAGSLFWFWWIRGHWSEARNRLDGALGRSHGAPRAALPQALFGAGQLAIVQGDFDRAEAALEQCVALSREIADREMTAIALMRLATAAQRRGRQDRATALHEEALTLARDLGDPWLSNLALRHAGLLAWHRGEYDRAESIFAESLATSRATGDTYHIGDCLRHLGLVALHRNDRARAAVFYAEGLAPCQEVGDRWNIGGCLEGSGQVACAYGRHEEAARLFGAAEVLCDMLGFHRAPSDEALRQKHVEAARAWMGDAAFEAARAEGRALSPDEAIAYAYAQMQAVSARPKSAWKRTVEAHPGLLTAREREIALLVTRGMTNHEIAHRLFIAERTVDAHVRHIFDKLGAHSRAQVAAWVGGQGRGRSPAG